MVEGAEKNVCQEINSRRREKAPGMEGKKMADMEKIEVKFEAGEACYWHHGELPAVNFMLAKFEDEDGDWVELYAEHEIVEDEDAGGDEGYDELKAEIIEQAAEYGIAADRLHFYYDD